MIQQLAQRTTQHMIQRSVVTDQDREVNDYNFGMLISLMLDFVKIRTQSC